MRNGLWYDDKMGGGGGGEREREKGNNMEGYDKNVVIMKFLQLPKCISNADASIC